MNALEQLNSYRENMLSTEKCRTLLQEYGRIVDGFIIFGAMQTGEKLKNILETQSLKVIGFLDEYVDIENMGGGGVKVYHSAEEIKNSFSHVCFIISSHLGSSQSVMKEKLHKVFGKTDILKKDVLLYCNHGYSMQRNDGVWWEKIDVIITNYCTLRCKDCCTLTPYVSAEHKKHFPLQELKESLFALNETIDGTANLDIIGGEPLLYPELSELIYYIHGLSNFYQIMVDTNGTIMPNRNVIEALAASDAMVHITDYGEVSAKKYEVLSELEKNNILVSCRRPDMLGWHDYGEIYDRGSGDRQWKKCEAKDCPTVYNGKFHVCSRDARYIERNMYTPVKGEYVDLNDQNLTSRRRIMKNLQKRDSAISGCRFCGGAIDKVVAGMQGKQLDADK